MESSLELTGYGNYAFVSNFEQQFNQDKWAIWMKNNRHTSLYIAAVYLLIIFALQKYMKYREPLKNRNVVALWNFSLSIFSIWGMLRVAPEMFHVLKNYGFEYSVCNPVANSVSSFWIYAFAFSKAVELLDTVLLVLMKQKLTFLHVSHHVLTLFFTWYGIVDGLGGARWMASLNYGVHSVMYTYFTLKAFRVNIPERVAICITLAQMAQFCVGIVLSIYALRTIYRNKQCATSLSAAIGMCVLSSFLLYLFFNFFLYRYNFKTSDKEKKHS